MPYCAGLEIQWWNLGGFVWSVGVAVAILFISGGVATQVWRYQHVPLSSKRLARWNLAIVVAIPSWILFYPRVYHRFERGMAWQRFCGIRFT